MQLISAVICCTTKLCNLIHTTNQYRMIIHSYRHFTTGHARRSSDPRSFKTLVIVPGVEHDTAWRLDIDICRRGKLNTTGLERFNAILVTHRSYDSLPNFFFTTWPPRLGSRTSTSTFFVFKTSRFKYWASHVLHTPTLHAISVSLALFCKRLSAPSTIRRRSVLQSWLWTCGVYKTQSGLPTNRQLYVAVRAAWIPSNRWKQSLCG